MDSIDKKISEANAPGDVLEPSNLGRLIALLRERQENGHIYLTLRGEGLPHAFAVLATRRLLDQLRDFHESGKAPASPYLTNPSFITPIYECTDLETPVYYGLN